VSGVIKQKSDEDSEEEEEEVETTGFRLTFHFADNPYFSNKVRVCGVCLPVAARLRGGPRCSVIPAEPALLLPNTRPTHAHTPPQHKQTLTKTYHMLDDVEPVLERSEGCSIDWKPGKNCTVKVGAAGDAPGCAWS
jgi:hypothetical protein